MQPSRSSVLAAVLFALGVALSPAAWAASHKTHAVFLGAVRAVPYSQAGDPAGAAAGETSLKIRALVVDGVLKEWTTGEMHDITDRSFVVRRAMRINDALSSDASAGKSGAVAERWVWQRGPWLLVDRAAGRVTALRLPDYDPGVSRVSWFRDYAAYCGLTPSGKSLDAIIAQVSARRPVLTKRLSAFHAGNAPALACATPVWQRDPMGVTFYPAGKDAVSYRIASGSAVLVEDAGGEPTAPNPSAKNPSAKDASISHNSPSSINPP